MTNPTTQALPAQNLDFSDEVAAVKSFLSYQDYFNRIDADASGMDVLVHLLAYVRAKGNMVAHLAHMESRLATARRRDSVVSRAKELGYVPSGATAARATLSLRFDEGSTPLPLRGVLDRNTTFAVDSASTTFATTSSYTAVREGSSMYFPEVEVVQGTFSTIDWVVDWSRSRQRFLIPGTKCDRSTVEVWVQEGVDDSRLTRWSAADSVLDVEGGSRVFFLQEASSGQTEVYFGDGSIGARPGHGKVVKAAWIDTDGEAGNGFSRFKFARTGTGNPLNSAFATVVSATKSAGGGGPEDLESIRLRTPLARYSQDRLIAPDDFKTFVARRFPSILSTSCWFGSRDYGRPGVAYISATTVDGTAIDSATQAEVAAAVRPRMVGRTDVSFVAPEFIDLSVSAVAYVRGLQVGTSATDVEDSVRRAIMDYGEGFLERFNAPFENSAAADACLAAAPSASSVDLSVTMSKDASVTPYQSTRLATSFLNEVMPGSVRGSYQESGVAGFVVDEGGVLYHSSPTSPRKALGAIDYSTGAVDAVLLSTGPQSVVTISARPVAHSVMVEKNSVLRVRDVAASARLT